MSKQVEFLGEGSLNEIGNIIKKECAQKVFLICGKKSFLKSGAKKVIDDLGLKPEIFNDFDQNPKKEEIDKGFSRFGEAKPNILLAIGGGSVIDVAKTIKLQHYEKTGEIIPMIAVPTTSGSGSEATWFAVYYENGDKISGGRKEITLPEYSILDPKLTYSLPKEIAAATSADAFSQAVESYWSVNSCEESKRMSEEAIRIMKENLIENINNPTKETKSSMLKAANLAGKAINLTQTTASHSISYMITSKFNVLHGQAVILTIPGIFMLNSECDESNCNDPRGIEYLKNTMSELGCLIDKENPIKYIREMMKKIGLKSTFGELGIGEKDIEIIANTAFNSARMKNNPRTLTSDDIKKVLESLI